MFRTGRGRETKREVQHIKTMIIKSKVGDRSRGWPEGSLFDSCYTVVSGRVLRLSLECSTLLLIHTLYCRVLSKGASITIFWVFGTTRPGIEPRFPGPLANTITTKPMGQLLKEDNNNSNLCLQKKLWILKYVEIKRLLNKINVNLLPSVDLLIFFLWHLPPDWF